MSFKGAFSKLGNTVKKTADNIAEKSSDVIETTKLNMTIKDEEDKISKSYIALGKLVYESYIDGREIVDLKGSCDSIKEKYDKIYNLKCKIKNIKEEGRNKNQVKN